MFYAYDWVDPIKWDAWLYRSYGAHDLAMKETIDIRLRAVATWTAHRQLPTAVGPGWIGYTPIEADFEDGPIGQYLATYAVERCRDLGYWGRSSDRTRLPTTPAGAMSSSSAGSTPPSWRERTPRALSPT